MVAELNLGCNPIFKRFCRRTREPSGGYNSLGSVCLCNCRLDRRQVTGSRAAPRVAVQPTSPRTRGDSCTPSVRSSRARCTRAVGVRQNDDPRIPSRALRPQRKPTFASAPSASSAAVTDAACGLGPGAANQLDNGPSRNSSDRCRRRLF